MPLLAPDLVAVTGLALAELDPLHQLSAAELYALIPDITPALVDEWTMAGSVVAAEWYDAERDSFGVAGRFRAIVEPLPDPGVEALIGWASELLRKPEPDTAGAIERLSGGLQKRIVNAANRTVTASTVADPQAQGWTRHTRAGGCDFCRMVASRGAVYSKATVSFACHEHCHCTAAPSWGGESLAVNAYKQSAKTADLTPEQRKALNRSAREWIAANLD